MINFLSSWVKSFGLSVVVVSILEMLLPNNKTKKYIRMIMGIYILFTMISPFISNKDIFDIDKIDVNFDEYALNRTSMDERIEDLYIEELEKDITKKIEEKGYEIKKCKVDAKISEDESKITKIKINAKKQENNKVNEENIENKIVTQIQKIKPVEINTKEETKTTTNLNKTDIQNIKKFLIDEYGVNEECLEIT